jgi:hypothetical protein
MFDFERIIHLDCLVCKQHLKFTRRLCCSEMAGKKRRRSKMKRSIVSTAERSSEEQKRNNTQLILSTTAQFRKHIDRGEGLEAIKMGKQALQDGLLDTSPNSEHCACIHELNGYSSLPEMFGIRDPAQLKEILAILIQSGTDINYCEPSRCYTCLTGCIIRPHFELFKLLLVQPNIQINRPISNECNSNAYSTCGQTPLILAYWLPSDPRFMDELLKRFYELDFQHRDNYGKTLLDYVKQQKQVGYVSYTEHQKPDRDVMKQKIRHTLNVVFPVYYHSIQNLLQTIALLPSILSPLIVSYLQIHIE